VDVGVVGGVVSPPSTTIGVSLIMIKSGRRICAQRLNQIPITLSAPVPTGLSINEFPA